LPEHQIAQFPLNERDTSKLLITGSGNISEDTFANIAAYLPQHSLLISNETKVVHARVLFQKTSGARIEVFCLQPVAPVTDTTSSFEQKSSCTWKCFIGNAKRWKSEILISERNINDKQVTLYAKKVKKEDEAYWVEFAWDPADLTFAIILDAFGHIPLPPYIQREAVEGDDHTYQTIFARHQGSVAAPTAGLHFTDQVIKTLKDKHIESTSITLHVGAGTFKPVSSDTIGNHQMHSEKVVVSVALLEKMIQNKNNAFILVGTTTVRTMESIYWQGVKWLKETNPVPVLSISQWDPYFELANETISWMEAYQKVVEVLKNNHLNELKGETSLMIAPGYTFRIADYIITNFHQPKSTLLLLVSAFAGEIWTKSYEYALKRNFRFLSYGDSCLFINPRKKE
jgi:S-adenosylmethionine:tRNA ribosyltransferase-isomerase